MILFAAPMTPFLKKWRKNTWLNRRGKDLLQFKVTLYEEILINKSVSGLQMVSIAVYVS